MFISNLLFKSSHVQSTECQRLKKCLKGCGKKKISNHKMLILKALAGTDCISWSNWTKFVSNMKWLLMNKSEKHANLKLIYTSLTPRVISTIVGSSEIHKKIVFKEIYLYHSCLELQHMLIMKSRLTCSQFDEGF